MSSLKSILSALTPVVRTIVDMAKKVAADPKTKELIGKAKNTVFAKR